MADSANGLTSRRQYLFLGVKEAWGLSKEQEPVWEEAFTRGYVRIEIRGGTKPQKVATSPQSVDNFAMNWDEDFRLDLTDSSKELRIMLCKEKSKDSSSKKTAAVVAACGIFIKDILEAVPIDKQFELFKPGEKDSTLGGYIRVTLNTGLTDPKVPSIVEREPHLAEEEQQGEQEPPADEPAPRGGRLLHILLLAGLAATITILRYRTQKKRNSS